MTGCAAGGCGTYLFEGVGGPLEARELCGLQGSLGGYNNDGWRMVFGAYTRDQTLALEIFNLGLVSEADVPHELMAAGTRLTLDDGLTARCYHWPEGLGMGDPVIRDADTASLEIHEQGPVDASGETSWRLTWDLQCPETTVTGSDWLGFEAGLF